MESDFKNITQELLEQARALGICGPWAQRMARMKTPEGLVGMYLRGIDFCFNYDYPNVDFIRKHFTGYCEKKGLYVDAQELCLYNPFRVAFVGDSKVDINCDNYSVSRIYMKHNSRVNLEASEHAVVLAVDCFDNSHVEIKAKNKALVNVYLYGNSTCHYEAEDAAKVRVIRKISNEYE